MKRWFWKCNYWAFFSTFVKDLLGPCLPASRRIPETGRIPETSHREPELLEEPQVVLRD